MQDIIASYDEKCRKIIDNMDSVKQFKEDFQKRQNEINRFKARSFFFYKIKHPIKLIKNRSESKRLKRINDTFYDIYNRSVVKYVKEETGDPYIDLDIPATKTKPNQIDIYVRSIQLKKVRKKCT